MFELLRHLFYISNLHIFPLHEDYGQDGADDVGNLYFWPTCRISTNRQMVALIFDRVGPYDGNPHITIDRGGGYRGGGDRNFQIFPRLALRVLISILAS